MEDVRWKYLKDKTMSRRFVWRYHIEIPCYYWKTYWAGEKKHEIGETGDEFLTSEIISLWLDEKIDHIEVKSEGLFYVLKEEPEKLIEYKQESLTEDEVEQILSHRRGGWRKGSGRKKDDGYGSKVMRIPSSQWMNVETILQIDREIKGKRKIHLDPDYLKWLRRSMKEWDKFCCEKLKEMNEL